MGWPYRRIRIALFELDVEDFDFYKPSDRARAVRNVRELLSALDQK